MTGSRNLATVSYSGLITADGDGDTNISVSVSGVTPYTVPVTVNTAQDTPPSVAILSPANGQRKEGNLFRFQSRHRTLCGGVTRIYLDVTGRQPIRNEAGGPSITGCTREFCFTVSAAAVGGSITVTARAEDTGGKTSDLVLISLNVVDKTAPAVAITQPANQYPITMARRLTSLFRLRMQSESHRSGIRRRAL